MVEKVELILMLIAYIALFNCIVRSDYNVVVSLVCFFYWNSRQTKTSRVALIIYIILGIVTVFDIIWLMIFWNSWTGSNWSSTIWNQLRFWHISVIITTIVNMVLKCVAILFVYLESKKESQYTEIKDNQFKTELR